MKELKTPRSKISFFFTSALSCEITRNVAEWHGYFFMLKARDLVQQIGFLCAFTVRDCEVISGRFEVL